MTKVSLLRQARIKRFINKGSPYQLMKKAQMEQPYVYIFALIVAALVIFLGYYMITGLLNLGKTVDTKRFEQDLRNEVRSVYDFTPGTTSYYKSNVPSDVKGVCFMDVGNVNVDDIKYDDIKVLVVEMKKFGTDVNLFYSVTSKAKQPEPNKIDKLKAMDSLVCKSTARGVLEIDLENKGNYVEVS